MSQRFTPLHYVPGLVCHFSGETQLYTALVHRESTPVNFPDEMSWESRSWFRVLSYYFAVQANKHTLASGVHSVVGMFEVDRDPLEEPNPPTPGIPVRYSIVDMGSDGDLRFRLYFNETIMSTSATAEDVFKFLYWHINAESARRTGDFVLIHAGAVATSGGSGVLIPGPSGAGKSTLVAGLVLHGFLYYSDEAAAIDPVSRRLYAYPKAITLKDQTVFREFPDLTRMASSQPYIGNRWTLVPSDLDANIVGAPCDVRYVFAFRYIPDLPTRIESISAGTAAVELGRNLINGARYGARVLPVLGDLVKDSSCYVLESGNLREAVDTIERMTCESTS